MQIISQHMSRCWGNSGRNKGVWLGKIKKFQFPQWKIYNNHKVKTKSNQKKKPQKHVNTKNTGIDDIWKRYRDWLQCNAHQNVENALYMHRNNWTKHICRQNIDGPQVTAHQHKQMWGRGRGLMKQKFQNSWKWTYNILVGDAMILVQKRYFSQCKFHDVDHRALICWQAKIVLYTYNNSWIPQMLVCRITRINKGIEDLYYQMKLGVT